MASVRKRYWHTTDGTQKSAWVADFTDPHTRKRRELTFTTQHAAQAWLNSNIALTVPADPAPYKDSVEARLGRIEAHLVALRAELDAVLQLPPTYRRRQRRLLS
jgi:hypothetical protein